MRTVDSRERKMRANFCCTNFLNTPRGPGHPGKNPGTSQIPLFETQGRQTFEGGHELFDPHPFGWKTPSPPGALRTKKVNLCALFFLPEIQKLEKAEAVLGSFREFPSKITGKSPKGPQGSVNGGFRMVVRVLWGNEITSLHLNLTKSL